MVPSMREAVPETRSTPDAGYAAGAAFVDGHFVPVGEARIPVLDWGFVRSDATYDVVHVWRGRFFRLEDHLDRFLRSCRRLYLTPPHPRAEIRGILMESVRLAGLRDAYVEMICTRGIPPPGSRDPRTCRNTFVAFSVPYVSIAASEQQARGLHLVIATVPRIPPASVDPTVKNYHWGDLTRGLFEAYERGGETALLVDPAGHISEGPGFNVFCVHGERLLTPSGTVLEGITRRTVMEIGDELGLQVEAGVLAPETVRGADEVFLTSTAGGVMPVTRVDGRRIGDGHAGPITGRLRERYWQRHEEPRYTTPVGYD